MKSVKFRHQNLSAEMSPGSVDKIPALPWSRYPRPVPFQLAAALSACFLVSLGNTLWAEDWPQWGGTPARNMYSNAKGLPDHFTKGKSSEIKFKPGTDEVDQSNIENLKWVAKIGSQSYGNVT